MAHTGYEAPLEPMQFALRQAADMTGAAAGNAPLARFQRIPDMRWSDIVPGSLTAARACEPRPPDR
jgi:hypothetical protein